MLVKAIHSRTSGTSPDKRLQCINRGGVGIALLAGTLGLASITAKAGPLDDLLNGALSKVPGSATAKKLLDTVNGNSAAQVSPPPVTAPATSGKPVRAEGGLPDDQKLEEFNYPAYSFKATLTTDYGKADLTTSVQPLDEADNRFTAAAKAMLNDVMHSITALQSGHMPAGLAHLKNSSLSPEEKAQVLGATVLILRSSAPIRESASYAPGTSIAVESRDAIENRTSPGAQAIARLARYMPEIKDIEYSWMQPVDPNARRDLSGYEIASPGNRRTGNLNQFLASGVEDKYPDGDKIHYRMYDEAFSPRSQATVDSALLAGRSAVPATQDPKMDASAPSVQPEVKPPCPDAPACRVAESAKAESAQRKNSSDTSGNVVLEYRGQALDTPGLDLNSPAGRRTLQAPSVNSLSIKIKLANPRLAPNAKFAFDSKIGRMNFDWTPADSPNAWTHGTVVSLEVSDGIRVMRYGDQTSMIVLGFNTDDHGQVVDWSLSAGVDNNLPNRMKMSSSNRDRNSRCPSKFMDWTECMDTTPTDGPDGIPKFQSYASKSCLQGKWTVSQQ